MSCAVPLKLVRDGAARKVEVPSDDAGSVSYDALVAFLSEGQAHRPSKMISGGKTLHPGDRVLKNKSVMLLGQQAVAGARRPAVKQPRWATTADFMSMVFSYLPFRYVRGTCIRVCRVWHDRNDICTRLHPQRYAVVGGDVFDLFDARPESVVSRVGYRPEDVVFSAIHGMSLYLLARPPPQGTAASTQVPGAVRNSSGGGGAGGESGPPQPQPHPAGDGVSPLAKDTLFLDQLGLVFENTAAGGFEDGPAGDDATLEAVLDVDNIRDVRAACERVWLWQRSCRLVHIDLRTRQPRWTLQVSDLLRPGASSGGGSDDRERAGADAAAAAGHHASSSTTPYYSAGGYVYAGSANTAATGAAPTARSDDGVIPLPIRRILATSKGAVVVQPDRLALYSADTGVCTSEFRRVPGWDHFYGPLFLPASDAPVGGGAAEASNTVHSLVLVPQGRSLHVLDANLHSMCTCHLSSPIRGVVAFNTTTGRVVVATGKKGSMSHTCCTSKGRPLWSFPAGSARGYASAIGQGQWGGAALYSDSDGDDDDDDDDATMSSGDGDAGDDPGFSSFDAMGGAVSSNPPLAPPAPAPEDLPSALRAARTIHDVFPAGVANAMFHFSDNNVLMNIHAGALVCDVESKHYQMPVSTAEGKVLALLEGTPPDSFAEALYMHCRDVPDRHAYYGPRPLESDDDLRDIALVDTADTLSFATNTSAYPKAPKWGKLAAMEKQAPPRQHYDKTKDHGHPDNIAARAYTAFVKQLRGAQEEQKGVAWSATPKSVIVVRGITRTLEKSSHMEERATVRRGLTAPLWSVLTPFPARSAVEAVVDGPVLYVALLSPPTVGIYAVARDCGVVAWRRTWEQNGIRSIRLIAQYGLVALEHSTSSKRQTSFFASTDGSLRHTVTAPRR